ncbi:MAG: TetR/AcrR family transcriptional regulator [Bacteroidales bacterium]|nr:TetR/AcrR family transcriptional regulator [Bacteroidales bacterium]
MKESKEDLLREEAIQAAQKLFQQYGFQKTTMEDIARAMGRGKSTLYCYYKSKDELFDAVVVSEMEEVFWKTQEAVEAFVSAEEKLRSYFSVFFKEMKGRINLYRIVRGELANDSLSIEKKLAEKFNTKEVSSVHKILQLGIEQKEFSPEFKDDVELLAYTIVSALRSTVLRFIVENKFHDWEDRLGVISGIVIKGLRP